MNSAVLTIRLSHEEISKLDSLREKQGISRTEQIRILILRTYNHNRGLAAPKVTDWDASLRMSHGASKAKSKTP